MSTYDPLNPEADEALAKEAADLRRAGNFPHPQSPKGMQLREAEVRVRSAQNPGQPVQGRGLPEGIASVRPDGRAELSGPPQPSDLSRVLPSEQARQQAADEPGTPFAKAVDAQVETVNNIARHRARLLAAYDELDRLRQRRASTLLAKGTDPGSFTITRKGS